MRFVYLSKYQLDTYNYKYWAKPDKTAGEFMNWDEIVWESRMKQ